jgi:hypothetical protein
MFLQHRLIRLHEKLDTYDVEMPLKITLGGLMNRLIS